MSSDFFAKLLLKQLLLLSFISSTQYLQIVLYRLQVHISIIHFTVRCYHTFNLFVFPALVPSSLRFLCMSRRNTIPLRRCRYLHFPGLLYVIVLKQGFSSVYGPFQVWLLSELLLLGGFRVSSLRRR